MPLLWVSLAFITGILLDSCLQLSWVVWLFLALISLGLGIAEKHLTNSFAWLGKRQVLVPLPLGVILAAFFFGALRCDQIRWSWTPSDVAFYNGQEQVILVGQIVDAPDKREDSVLLRIRTADIILPQSGEKLDVSGDVAVRLKSVREWQYGDRIALSGKLEQPPENEAFSYRAYLARQDIYAYMAYPQAELLEHGGGSFLLRGIYQLRERAQSLIMRSLPQPESSLLVGILLGQENDIPDQVDKDFRDTGTTHIIAISGFNIALLVGVISFLFRRTVRRWWLSILLTLATIALYTVLVGGDPPVVRAAVMGSMGVLGAHIGRRQAGINSLGFTAAFMCLFNPYLLWDAGFQLSFMATLGLVLFAEPLTNGFSEFAERFVSESTVKRIAGPIGEYVLLTVAAQITTLPVIMYHFGRVSLSSFIANIFILPAQPFVMFFGGAAMVVGLLLPAVGQFVFLLAWVPLAYTTSVVERLAALWSGTLVLGNVGLVPVIVLYGCIFSVPLIWKHKHAWRRWIRMPVILLILCFVATVIWKSVLTLPDDRLHVYVLDVVDGPAYLVVSPKGGRVLINGSSSERMLGQALEMWMPLFNRDLDWLLISGTANDALLGLPAVVERFSLESVLWNNVEFENSVAWRLRDVLKEQEVDIYDMETDQFLDFGEGSGISIFSQEETGAVAYLLVVDEYQMLIPGGVQYEQMEEMLYTRALLDDIDVFLLCEDDLADDNWLQLQQEGKRGLVVWSGNQIFDVDGISVWQHGWVHITAADEQMWIETQH